MPPAPRAGAGGGIVHANRRHHHVEGLRWQLRQMFQRLQRGMAGTGMQRPVHAEVLREGAHQLPEQGFALMRSTHSSGGGIPQNEQPQFRPRAGNAATITGWFRQRRRYAPHMSPLQQQERTEQHGGEHVTHADQPGTALVVVMLSTSAPPMPPEMMSLPVKWRERSRTACVNVSSAEAFESGVLAT